MSKSTYLDVLGYILIDVHICNNNEIINLGGKSQRNWIGRGKV